MWAQLADADSLTFGQLLQQQEEKHGNSRNGAWHYRHRVRLIPFVGIIVTVPCMLVGLPLSIVGLVQGRNNGTGVGMAVAGLVCNLIALLIFLIMAIVFGAFIFALFG
jgi:hypothetical protein